jgi:eukaryotic-like serine/threonine-protein kinase
VLDFGISKYTEASQASKPDLTAPRTPLGSPQYMSPEQLRDSSSVDKRSDIWSMGIVLHEMLCGAVPFDARSVAELYGRIINDAPTRLRKVRGDVPPGLEKDPGLRPQDSGELAALLAPYAHESIRSQIQSIQTACQKHQRSHDRSGSLIIEKRPSYPPPAIRSRRSVVLGLALVTAAGVGAYVVAPHLVAKQGMDRASAAPATAQSGAQRKSLDLSLTPAPTPERSAAVPPSSVDGARDANGKRPLEVKGSPIDGGSESKRPAPTIPEGKKTNRTAPAPSSQRIRSSKQITPIE